MTHNGPVGMDAALNIFFLGGGASKTAIGQALYILNGGKGVRFPKRSKKYNCV